MTTAHLPVDPPEALRAVVVDDEPLIRLTVAETLRRRGMEVVEAADGRAGLDALLRGGARLAVLDIGLPDLDGISVLRALREHFDRDALPVIVISARDAEDDIVGALEAGANDYLVKPFPPALLAAKVTALLGRTAAPALPRWTENGRLPARFDRWTLERVIGHGAHGIVYAGRDGKQAAAVKILHPYAASDRVALARHFREVATLGEVDSPHVARLLGSGHAEDHFFIAMELVPGRTALRALEEDGPWEVTRAMTLGRDVALALRAIRTAGLVHRDVKPSNIVVRPDGRAVLVDFGLAKRPHDALTATHEVVGTPEYMAPEVVADPTVEPESDVYALGATLYHLLAARTLVSGATGTQALLRLTRGDRGPRLDLQRPDLHPNVVALVEALVDPLPERRPRLEAVIARCSVMCGGANLAASRA